MSLGYRDVGLLFRTLRCRVFGTADLGRWTQIENHDVRWSERSRLIAGLIPAGARVIEFGAGRRTTETFLKPGCRYFPSDLVSRGDDTIICDLNHRPLPDLRSLALDAAVFGGVLEYLQDLRSVISWLAGSVTLCVASYECARSQPRTFGRFQEQISRAWSGWVNTYDEEELMTLFHEAGFVLSRKLIWETDEGNEPVFAFQWATDRSPR